MDDSYVLHWSYGDGYEGWQTGSYEELKAKAAELDHERCTLVFICKTSEVKREVGLLSEGVRFL